MALFENAEYQWRETLFVFFEDVYRPEAKQVADALNCLGRLEIRDLRADDSGLLETVTIFSPDDFSAMDIVCIVGDEVREQIPDVMDKVEPNLDSDEQRAMFNKLKTMNARFDVLHFQKQMASLSGDDDGTDEFLDPGSLLAVLDQLGELCHGVAIDPQSDEFM